MKKSYIGTLGFIGLLLLTTGLHNWVALICTILSPLFILLLTVDKNN